MLHWLFMVLRDCSFAGTFEISSGSILTIQQIDIYRFFFCFPVHEAIIQVFVLSYLHYLPLQGRGWVGRGGHCSPRSHLLVWWVPSLGACCLGLRAPPPWWRNMAGEGEAGLHACIAATWFPMATGTAGGCRCISAAAIGFWLHSGKGARCWGTAAACTLCQLWYGGRILMPPLLLHLLGLGTQPWKLGHCPCFSLYCCPYVFQYVHLQIY